MTNGGPCSSQGFGPRRSDPPDRVCAARPAGTAADQQQCRPRRSSGRRRRAWPGEVGNTRRCSSPCTDPTCRVSCGGHLQASRFHAMPAAPQLPPPPPPHVVARPPASTLPPFPPAGAVGLVVPEHTRDAFFQVRSERHAGWCPLVVLPAAAAARQQRHSAPIPTRPARRACLRTAAGVRPARQHTQGPPLPGASRPRTHAAHPARLAGERGRSGLLGGGGGAATSLLPLPLLLCRTFQPALACVHAWRPSTSSQPT